MKFKKNLLVLFAISIMICSCLSGCWNNREVNSLAFITSMGFDKSDKGMLVTIQVLNPRAIASQKYVDEPAVITYTEEGEDTIEMIRRMITRSSRKLNGTHLEVIIFSEDFAKEGISEVLDFMSREHQFRSQLYFAVAKGVSAEEVLNTLTDMDTNPAIKLHNALEASDKIWAGTKSVKLISLVNSIISDGTNPLITGVEVTSISEKNHSVVALREVESDPVKIKDLAVFRKDKFVGWFDEPECKGYNYIAGNVKGTMAFVESESLGKYTLEVTGTKTKTTAALIDGKPHITVEIDVMANIETVAGGLDITKDEDIKKIEKLAEEKLLFVCMKSLNKAQKELDSDVFGFGEVIHRTYPKLWVTMKDDWNSTFKDLPVEIKGHVKIEKTGTISNSFFKKEE